MTLTKKLNVTKLHINSEVQCRFATTEINSRVENVSAQAEESEFVANLPEGAFITYFEMEIDGKVIVGDVREKQQAKASYDAAKSRGETAGHVAQAARETNTFNISVNIAPFNFARFKLIYQELLLRVRGTYKHQINVHPGQAVDDLQVNVTVKERNSITILHVPKFAAKLSDKSNKELLLLKKASDVQTEKVSDTEMTVKWHPSAINQTQYLMDDILDGQLIVLYDVDRNDNEVLVVDGHFIHFLAPKNLDIGSKNIVFALDISGSMSNRKLEQTKTAMRSILNQLRSMDQFSILCFDTQLEVWKKKPVLATKENVSEAIGFVDAQHPRGGTDIDLAVQEGIKWLKGTHPEQFLANILVLLTDGQHNQGGCSSSQITPRILKARIDGGRNIKVYGLGFGSDADFNLLREMSTKTGGFARKIYEASDAAIQLDSFYAEISSPQLAELDIKYLNPNAEVSSTVKNINGDTLFEGSEFIVIGKLNQLSLNEGDEIFEWQARSCHGPKVFKCCYHLWRPLCNSNKGEVSKTAGSFIERSWAYLTVKNLLEKAKIDPEESAMLKSQALKLALQYKFVTELTSMVVNQAERALELDQMDRNAILNPILPMSMSGISGRFAGGYSSRQTSGLFGTVSGRNRSVSSFGSRSMRRALIVPTSTGLFSAGSSSTVPALLFGSKSSTTSTGALFGAQAAPSSGSALFRTGSNSTVAVPCFSFGIGNSASPPTSFTPGSTTSKPIDTYDLNDFSFGLEKRKGNKEIEKEGCLSSRSPLHTQDSILGKRAKPMELLNTSDERNNDADCCAQSEPKNRRIEKNEGQHMQISTLVGLEEEKISVF